MSEIRALLLTDVVDSTKLSEAIGDAAMAEVWAAHDRAARDLLPGFHGLEIDKTDGMLLMFESPSNALNYATAYHKAMTTLPVPVKARAGLHVGPVILRENSPADVARGAKPIEVDGLAKPTAARVMSLARGGQTLLTPEARLALGETELQFQSHGHWVLKGLAEPIELFEPELPDAPMLAPPDSDKVYRVVKVGERWLPVKQIPNNLPQQATSFLGRERELDEIKAKLVGGARLITLLGMGGLGKTRLSLQVAAEVMPLFTDGAWFLDLSPIRDPAFVISEAAQIFEVREEPGRPLLQTLCAHLKQLKVLLIVDNCEHLMGPSAELANALLRAAPGVHIMASSRESLRVPGEQIYPVMPLAVPKRGDSVDALLRSPAVHLFAERARLHKPSFELNEKEAPAVAELVARLEGIPLALELAAARVRSMSVQDINLRLKDRYKLLTGGGRVLQERQQTLRALVDWSYDMLSEDERRVLNRIGMFAGGFDLAAAEFVCGTEPLTDFDVLDLLASLVEKSLVMLDEQGDTTRYRTLETIRDYAREKLEQSGEIPLIAARHCEHYFAFAKEANRGLKGEEQVAWTRRIEDDLDNLRGATALSLTGAVDPFIPVKFAVALLTFWMLRGYSTEGRSLVRAALALPAVQASEMAQAHALYVGATLAESQSDYAEARKMLETCLSLRRALANPVDIAATLSTLTLTRLPMGDTADARKDEQEALEMFRQLKDRVGEAIGLLHLGQIGIYEGNDDAARADIEQCLAIARDLKHFEIEGESELMLGEIAFEAGDWELAGQQFERSLKVCREAGDKRGDAKAVWHLGKVAIERGELESAQTQLAQALQVFRSFEMSAEVLGCLEDQARLAQARDQQLDAVRIMANATLSRDRLGIKRHQRAEARWQALLDGLRQAVPEGEFAAAWSEGQTGDFEAKLLGGLVGAGS
jgi:predicted ATPase/class 3 adenylate cyclase